MANNYQQSTTYLDEDDVFRGNVAISISPYQATPSYTSIGALTDVSIQRNLQTTEEQVDNAPGEQRIFKEDATIKFNHLESLNQTVAALMFGSSDTFADTAAAPVAANVQTIAANWTDQMWYLLDGQQSSGAQPTMTSVVGSVTGALAADAAGIDDYTISKNSAGEWGIQFNTNGVAGAVTTESIAITTAYTPAASTKQTFGTGSTLSKFLVKMVGLNQGNRQVTYIFYLCQVENLDAVTFAADDAEDARVTQPITITAKPDGLYNSYAVGEKVTLAS